MVISLVDAVTAFGLLASIGAFLFWFARLFERFSKLEQQAGTRKEDIQIILRAMLACLDGLEQQGVNGMVTKTGAELREYIIRTR